MARTNPCRPRTGKALDGLEWPLRMLCGRGRELLEPTGVVISIKRRFVVIHETQPWGSFTVTLAPTWRHFGLHEPLLPIRTEISNSGLRLSVPAFDPGLYTSFGAEYQPPWLVGVNGASSARHIKTALRRQSM